MAMDEMKPINNLVNPMLTDLYEITMAYAMWKNGRHEISSVFDLFFRSNPFEGEFTIFCGLEEVLRYVSNFHFTPEQIKYIKHLLPHVEEAFLQWLSAVDCSKLKIYALKEGTICFPKIPLIRVEGPMGVCQLLETTLLCLVNYPSLVATNAARHRLAAGKDKRLIEFGLRRAQGPDGAISASRFAYIGGFDGSSNVEACFLFQIPASGTHAHSFVQSFTGYKELKDSRLVGYDGMQHDLLALALDFRQSLGYTATSETELLSFVAFARSFPSSFVALVDTYDTLSSGVPNFLCVALALDKIGYRATGVRLDSGDLSYESKETRKMFREVGQKYHLDYFENLTIIASNEISEDVILSLNRHGHEIDTFAVGTHLVTCKNQPALGCVYKLVEINGKPCIKLSQDIAKVTIPGRKQVYRLYSTTKTPLIDLMVPDSDSQGERKEICPGTKVFCQHPFDAQKRANVTPTYVEKLHHLVWDQGKIIGKFPSSAEIKAYCLQQVEQMREDHLRPLNPSPYKIAVTAELYSLIHKMWNEARPLQEIH